MPEALEYRLAEPREIPDVARLVMHSFPGAQRTFESWNEQLADPVYGGGAETMVVGLDRDRIVAACQIHPLEQWVSGSPLSIAGVGTVTVSPAYRKRRIAGALVEAAHQIAYDRGDVGAALYPFRVSFYQKLGYGTAGEALQYLVPPTSLPDAPERMNVEVADLPEARTEILDWYNQWARTQTGQMTRSARTFAKIMSVPDRGLFAYRNDAGRIEGYALVTYRTDLPRRDRYLEVEEVVWSTVTARRGLMGWLSSLGDQWEQIMLRTLQSERLGDVIREPRMPGGTAPLWLLWSPAAMLMMGPMFRILNMEKAWSQRALRTRISPVVLDVRDDMKQNAGLWKLSAHSSGNGINASVERVAEAGTADMPRITTDISTLSRLYIGSMPATAALRADLLVCDRADVLHELDSALELPEPWTFDRF